MAVTTMFTAVWRTIWIARQRGGVSRERPSPHPELISGLAYPTAAGWPTASSSRVSVELAAKATFFQTVPSEIWRFVFPEPGSWTQIIDPGLRLAGSGRAKSSA